MTLYRMEGVDSQVFNYGTANAKTVTLSFWIKCSKAGNFQVNFENEQNPDAGYQTQQTINSANTWEKKVVTILVTHLKHLLGLLQKQCVLTLCIVRLVLMPLEHQVLLGVLYLTHKKGGHCNIDLFDSTSNYVRITGVQLELGDHATDFEHLPYQLNFNVANVITKQQHILQ